MIEWYTLPENLYRAYLLTGEKKYLDFAREWDYTYLWDKLNAHDSAIGPRHAYSQVNSFSSAAMAYLATGDKKYLDAAENGYALVTEKHTYATGGYGPAECLFADEKGFLGEMLKDSWDPTPGGRGGLPGFYGSERHRLCPYAGFVGNRTPAGNMG